MNILTTAPAGSPEWLKARSGRITATRAANIICSGMEGVSTFKSALEEFADLKRELSGVTVVEDDEDEEREARMRWGLDSEELHLMMLTRETGWTFEAAPCVVQSAKRPWLACSLDAFVKRPQDPSNVGLAELKAPTSWQGISKWKDGKLPMNYQVQLAVELHCTGLSWGILSALIPPSIQWAPIEYDAETEEWVVTALEEFWENLQRDIPPKPQCTERDEKAYRELKKPIPGATTKLSRRAYQAHLELEAAKAQAKHQEDIIRAAKLTIMEELGDAELGVFADGSGYTFKGSVRHNQAKEASVTHIAPSLKFTKNAT